MPPKHSTRRNWILGGILVQFLFIQGCGVSGGDGGGGGGGNTVPVVVTVTMPGPTVARAPEGLFQYLWAKVHQEVAPMMAWAENAPRSAQQEIPKTPSTIPETQKATLAEAYGKLPLAFEPNQGQPNGARVYIANEQSNLISVLNPATDNVVAGFTPDGTRVYVTNFDTDVVLVVSRATRLVVATIPVGDALEGIAIYSVVSAL